MSDQCQLMTDQLLVCSDIQTKILIIHSAPTTPVVSLVVSLIAPAVHREPASASVPSTAPVVCCGEAPLVEVFSGEDLEVQLNNWLRSLE